MPKVQRGRKAPPEGWELIEPTLTELGRKMREAENEPTEAKRKVEATWPIMRLHHQRTRYVYDIFFRRKAISRDLYNYCIKEGYADALLIAKWKKPGYEKLCCLKCIQPKDTNFSTTCICRFQRRSSKKARSLNAPLADAADAHQETSGCFYPMDLLRVCRGINSTEGPDAVIERVYHHATRNCISTLLGS
ncbi:G10 protein-domain-containing protein [Entophlyctis helioformis]|nr:G10 protein-domain-containing protein [Entophlyctis helioformis]